MGTVLLFQFQNGRKQITFDNYVTLIYLLRHASRAPPFYLEIVNALLDIEKYRHSENDPKNPIFNNTNIRIAGLAGI